MNLDDFEKELRRRPLRRVPPEWKAQIVPAATVNHEPWWGRLAEYIWPSRIAWGALAAAWVAIGVLRLTTVETSTPGTRHADYAQLRVVIEQKRKLQEAEYESVNVSKPAPAIRPRSGIRHRSVVG